MKDNLDYLIQRVGNSRKKKIYDEDTGWEKVRKRSLRREKHRTYLKMSGYAACTLITLGVILFMTNTSTPKKENVFVQEVMPQQSNIAKVELILANGKNINLEQINNLHEEELGISIIRDSINNQLTYQSSEIQKETTEIRYNRLVVPKGADFSFKLPDSSVVTVNSESILWFPIQFATDNRTVYLEGEAYFDVSKNENAPFKVITGDRTITVLGTKFNVCSFLDDPNWSTTLVEGKVSISNGDTHCVLKPSEQYIVDNRTGKAEVKHVNVELYTSWLNGKLHFKDYRLEDIIRKLERWYDFTIIYQEEEIKDMKFRGVIDKDRSLKETLHLLEETKTISFEIKGNIICVCKKEIQ